MGEHCVSDRPLSSSSAQPTGELTQINSIDVYISKPADYPHHPSRLLLLLSSGTGIKSTNNQLQADGYAAEGYIVVMPDQFGGDPAPSSNTPAPGPMPSSEIEDVDDTRTASKENAGGGAAGEGAEDASIIEQVKLRAAETAKSFMLDMWLARHTPEKVLPILHKVLDGAKEEFADAVANGGGVYAAGYCFGGKYVAMLAGKAGGKTEEQQTNASHASIKAGAIAHGTLITTGDLSGIEVPVSFVCVGESSCAFFHAVIICPTFSSCGEFTITCELKICGIIY